MIWGIFEDCVGEDQYSTMINKLNFHPHILFRGGHLQTMAGFYWPSRGATSKADVILVKVSDGDMIALHDDCPPSWTAGGKVALLIHGLAGCHGSGYMFRIARKLNIRGIRTFRMDMRGTGAATGRARMPGHAGRTDDAAAAIRFISGRCANAPLTIIGFSMGGNIALGTLADASSQSIGNLRRGIAVSPPVDLSKCCRELRTGFRNVYDKYLIRFLVQRWRATGGQLMGPRPNSIYQFDDQITAPLSGFRDAEDYYANASSGPRLRNVTLPTRILAAKDDPVVAYSAIEKAERSQHVELFTTESGGHLGYLSNKSLVSDRRWMDWLVAEWMSSEW